METREKENLQKAWLESSKEDFLIAKDLIGMKHYQWALFLCHIAIEKVLKANYVKINNTYPPPIHKLNKLATDCNIKLSEDQISDLREMTTFNIEARYDVIKDKLYKKATKEFTVVYFEKTKKLLKYFISLM